jgi:hypothetical protein
MPKKSFDEHQFVVMWDCNGLEYVADITVDNQRVMWEKLQGNETPRHAYANPQHLILRARYNSQRHYEIYTFNAVSGINEQDIRDMFEDNPQMAADTIRRIGHCFYSDRATQEVAIR